MPPKCHRRRNNVSRSQIMRQISDRDTLQSRKPCFHTPVHSRNRHFDDLGGGAMCHDSIFRPFFRIVTHYGGRMRQKRPQPMPIDANNGQSKLLPRKRDTPMPEPKPSATRANLPPTRARLINSRQSPSHARQPHPPAESALAKSARRACKPTHRSLTAVQSPRTCKKERSAVVQTALPGNAGNAGISDRCRRTPRPPPGRRPNHRRCAAP